MANGRIKVVNKGVVKSLGLQSDRIHRNRSFLIVQSAGNTDLETHKAFPSLQSLVNYNPKSNNSVNCKTS